jgi:hypothetical protein
MPAGRSCHRGALAAVANLGRARIAERNVAGAAIPGRAGDESNKTCYTG